MTNCKCVATHIPKVVVHHTHHVVPLAWVRAGATQTEGLTTVEVCPTTHEHVHNLLNAFVRYNGLPPWEIRRQFNEYVRWLAFIAWINRPPTGKIPYTTIKG